MIHKKLLTLITFREDIGWLRETVERKFFIVFYFVHAIF